MYGVNELIGASGSFSLDGYNLPGDKEWSEEMLEVLHADIPGSHDLLIAIVLTQECAELRERSSMAMAVVLSEYESTLGQPDALRARTFFVAAITELKMVLDELKDQPQAEQEKVLSRLGDYFGEDVKKFDTSFEGMEQVYLLSNPNTGRYWMSLKRHA
ncbi:MULTISPECIES: hypothetical protein [Pseudomonas]|jgi:hypothetical protein|uniref:hypothetical protein n=1 Tax=Pseudomonas TaxID=286 RepID=UPI00064C3EB9|nr:MULTISPECIES: hypothetical protein [Pseudomonas]MBH8615086.1 hypothetical protein [Pseudomonas mohnii]NMX42450.1 hypothetical protein [Pseudomonas veronii]UHH00887.1 hypothetical protein LQ249_30990 [Pseudomonas sp. 7-41]